MHKLVIPLLLFLLLASHLEGASGTVEDPKRCRQCGMDRIGYAQSRMLIAYAGGTVVGVCSLRCAAVELQQDMHLQIITLKVADYRTKELIDARTATWVIGGKKKGVMTATAKWAFARTEDALQFVEDNGGMVASLDQAMQAATDEVLKAAEEEKAVERDLLREMNHTNPTRKE